MKRIEKVHISRVAVGDVVIHEGVEKTVCSENLKTGFFMGTTLFGDSYHLGHRLVSRILFPSK